MAVGPSWHHGTQCSEVTSRNHAMCPWEAAQGHSHSRQLQPQRSLSHLDAMVDVAMKTPSWLLSAKSFLHRGLASVASDVPCAT